jgi:hypothetical protein
VGVRQVLSLAHRLRAALELVFDDSSYRLLAGVGLLAGHLAHRTFLISADSVSAADLLGVLLGDCSTSLSRPRVAAPVSLKRLTLPDTVLTQFDPGVAFRDGAIFPLLPMYGEEMGAIPENGSTR